MLSAPDTDDDLIKVPFVAGCRETPSNLVSEALAKFRAHCHTVS
jgi:hypothetical protein